MHNTPQFGIKQREITFTILTYNVTLQSQKLEMATTPCKWNIQTDVVVVPQISSEIIELLSFGGKVWQNKFLN